MKYWLMKSEPKSFSFEDLKNALNQTTPWDGVRNYQARNFMKNEMKIGDIVLFYHSNCAEPGVVGLGMVASEAYPDFTQFDINSKYHDPKSRQDNPRWFLVDIKYLMDFPKIVTLSAIKDNENLNDMLVVKKGMRLSIQPVKDAEFKEIVIMSTLTVDKVFEEYDKIKKSI
ncbi:EVE domain-containing protein [Deferribacteraceae bacterium V6Fe1]|nr:EVE domain-containing protein [Deferribacteraceae bacterium V6Fe1]